MRKSILTSMLFAATSLNSCDVPSTIKSITSPVAGKTFYVLNVKDLVVQETQLNFNTDNTVEARFTLNAMSGDCYTYKNTPSLSNKSIMMHYSVNDEILKIEELDLSVSIGEIDNNDLFYQTSIVEHLNDSVGYKRILAHSSNERLVDMYMEMINNNSDSPIGEEVIVQDPNGGRPMKTYSINSSKNKNNPYKSNPLGSNKNNRM